MINGNYFQDWVVIVNPNAGSRRAVKDWQMISDHLSKKGFVFESDFTLQKMHAFELTSAYIKKGLRKFIIVGGDGTLNEVVNAFFDQNNCNPKDLLLALIPVGTGNDWGRMFNIPTNYTAAIDVIANAKIFTQDLGKVKYFKDDGEKTRYFANIAGIGYDALVAKRTNILKEKKWAGGALLYLYSLVLSLITYKIHKAKIKIDETQGFEAEIFSLSIGIGKFNGGGMMQLPDAIANDGLFDLTIIRKITRLDVVKNIKNLYDGSFTKHPSVKTFKAKYIRIESAQDFFLEVDGESLGHSPLTFEIKPLALNVISG